MASSPVTQSSGSFSALPCGWLFTVSVTGTPLVDFLSIPPTDVFRVRSLASGRVEGEVERLGHRLVADLAARDVEACGKVRVRRHRRVRAEIGNLEDEGESGVVQCEGG